MARALSNVLLFLAGNPDSASPSRAFMTYSVTDGEFKKDNCLYEFESVDWGQATTALWDAGVAQIELNEGI